MEQTLDAEVDLYLEKKRKMYKKKNLTDLKES